MRYKIYNYDWRSRDRIRNGVTHKMLYAFKSIQSYFREVGICTTLDEIKSLAKTADMGNRDFLLEINQIEMPTDPVTIISLRDPLVVVREDSWWFNFDFILEGIDYADISKQRERVESIISNEIQNL